VSDDTHEPDDGNADDGTRRLLRASDPAASLPPVTAGRLAELLEDTMTGTRAPQERAPAHHRRRILAVGLVAAAAVAAVGVVGAGLLGNDDQRDGGRGGDSVVASGESTTRLTAGPAVAAKCAVPDAGFVAQQEVAFEGTVTSVADGLVTLDPDVFWAGDPTDVVTVDQPDLAMTEMPVDFRVGATYIVGATDGRVSICGLSGPATDELRALYVEAFGAG
jgi:hypothetical protein